MKTTFLTTLLLILTFTSTAVMPKSFTAREIKIHNTLMISKMINVVQPEINEKKRMKIAAALFNSSVKYAVDPKIMVAIIDTESDFRHHMVSTTGDLSLAQINTEVWNKEFTRLGLDKIDTKQLKKDEAYALNKMAKILSILKKRHANKDAQWYAIYHSKTKKFKSQYGQKVDKRLRMIASVM